MSAPQVSISSGGTNSSSIGGGGLGGNGNSSVPGSGYPDEYVIQQAPIEAFKIQSLWFFVLFVFHI